MEDRLIELLDSVSASVAGVAPDVWAALVLSATVESWLSFVLIVPCVFWAWFYSSVLAKVWSHVDDHNDISSFFSCGFVVIGGVLAALCVMYPLVAIGTSLNWIGVFNPEARAIIELISRVG